MKEKIKLAFYILFLILFTVINNSYFFFIFILFLFLLDLEFFKKNIKKTIFSISFFNLTITLGYIIFTSIIATIIFREALQRKEYFSYSTILCGSIIIPIYIDLAANNYQISQFVYGDFLIIFAGLFYGIEMNVYRYLSDKIDAKRILQIISFVGGIVTISLVFLLQIPLEFKFEYMPTILISGMLGIGISVLFIVVAIKNIGAVRTILIFSTTTLFGIIFSHIILNEKIISLHLIAFVMVFIGIILLRTKMTD
ncbi:MAG: DMT family transporter [Candidatus Nitrosotenuis sp.]